MEIKDFKYKPILDSSRNEIDAWRHYFIEEMFSHKLKHIPEKYKQRIAAYFLSIPSECFQDPIQEWYNCISALLQHMEDIK